eukprot:18259-Heterococcus_DN1.PRE.3
MRVKQLSCLLERCSMLTDYRCVITAWAHLTNTNSLIKDEALFKSRLPEPWCSAAASLYAQQSSSRSTARSSAKTRACTRYAAH